MTKTKGVTRKCAYDDCCEFEPVSWNHIYCTRCGCRRKLATDVARVDKESQFEQPLEYQELNIRSAPDGFKVLIINDLHRPFHDRKTLTCIENFWNELKPDLEFYNGDIGDLYCISQYDKNPSRKNSLQDEFDDQRGWLEHRVKKNPGARKVYDPGNHGDRARRWLWKFGPEMSSLRSNDLSEQLGLKEMDFEVINYGSVVNFLSFRMEHGYKTTASKAYPLNTSRWMAIATGSSGLCGHTHRFSHYAWTDSRGSHSYIENGCVCMLGMEYAPFPNWQHAFTWGVVYQNKIHLRPTLIYPDGFYADGEFYRR